MTTQDVVVYLALVAVILLYRVQFTQNEQEGHSRLAFVWTWVGLAFATYFMSVGVLHQVGMLGGVWAYALFGMGVVLLLVCLRTLRMKMRTTSTTRVSKEDSDSEGE
jgi:quinol-cytochrome oxidoreductase complex cytochrome b subunit